MRHWPPLHLQSPLGPVLLCLHGNAPCLLPGLPLVGTSFSHLLLSGGVGQCHGCQRLSPLPPPLLPTGSLCLYVLPGKAGRGTICRGDTWTVFSPVPFPQRRGSDSRPFPRTAHPCLPQQVSLDRPTLPCPCSRKGLSAPVGLVSLLGMLLPDACHAVALGVLGTLEGCVGARV